MQLPWHGGRLNSQLLAWWSKILQLQNDLRGCGSSVQGVLACPFNCSGAGVA
ncbi:conserved hypothetical protein [Ricinus communis]|uniref:Uncharacterized protein n=1 Tax=Ricinus communis TaxID=3988 RepID=B9SF30_RICCO|nr:conserved hypothetical protein [Ricinus communis]